MPIASSIMTAALAVGNVTSKRWRTCSALKSLRMDWAAQRQVLAHSMREVQDSAQTITA